MNNSISYEAGLLNLVPKIRKLLNNPSLTRLQKTAQLGQNKWNFAGATHTRYEHVVMAAYIATVLALELDRHGQLPKPYSVADIACTFLEHDEGHGGLGHAGESAKTAWIRKTQGREVNHNTATIDRIVNSHLDSQGVWHGIVEAGGDPHHVIDLLTKEPGKALVKSVIGPDPLAYLTLDSERCGLSERPPSWQGIVQIARFIDGIYGAEIEESVHSGEEPVEILLGQVRAKGRQYRKIYFGAASLIKQREAERGLLWALEAGIISLQDLDDLGDDVLEDRIINPRKEGENPIVRKAQEEFRSYSRRESMKPFLTVKYSPEGCKQNGGGIEIADPEFVQSFVDRFIDDPFALVEVEEKLRQEYRRRIICAAMPLKSKLQPAQVHVFRHGNYAGILENVTPATAAAYQEMRKQVDGYWSIPVAGPTEDAMYLQKNAQSIYERFKQIASQYFTKSAKVATLPA